MAINQITHARKPRGLTLSAVFHTTAFALATGFMAAIILGFVH